MTTTLRGLFAHKLPDGTITDVQVEDPHGNGHPMPFETYRHRGVQPASELLPDQHQDRQKS